MPKFKVLRRVDAFVNFIAEVEAETPADAARKACDDERPFQWEEIGTNTFDARVFVALDADGDEVDNTACGDF